MRSQQKTKPVPVQPHIQSAIEALEILSSMQQHLHSLMDAAHPSWLMRPDLSLCNDRNGFHRLASLVNSIALALQHSCSLDLRLKIRIDRIRIVHVHILKHIKQVVRQIPIPSVWD